LDTFVSPPGKQIPGILIFGFVPKGGNKIERKAKEKVGATLKI